MVIMVVAQRNRLRELMNLILDQYPDDIVVPMDDGMSAVQYAYHNPVDSVYTCLKVPPLNGLFLGHMVQKKYPHVKVNLIADTDEYLNDAMQRGCTGYYMEPVSGESLKNDNLLRLNSIGSNMGRTGI